MIARVLTTACLLLATAAHADTWTGYDKGLHLRAGYATAAVVGRATGDPLLGFAAGVTLGLLKEARDATGLGHVSGKDPVVTLIGAALGAYAVRGLVLARVDSRTVLMFNKEF